MAVRKGLVVSALLVFWSGLVLGTLALAPFAESGEGGKAQEGRYVVTVPLGAIGDEVVYREYARTDTAANHTLESVLAFHVERLTETYDRAGVDRRALVVYSQQDPGPRNRTYLDVSSRAIVRADLLEEAPSGQRVTSVFGPVGNPLLAVPDEVRFQGVTFEEGMDLRQFTRQGFAARLGVDQDRAILFNYQAYVDGPGIVNGMQGMAIRFEGKVLFQGVPEDGENRLFGFKVPRSSLVPFEQTVWITPDVPYPVLMEQEVRVEAWGQTMERYFTMTQMRHGNETIPWITPPMAVSYPAKNPDVSRARDGIHYPTGDGGFGYPMEEAYVSVRDDPSLAQFHLWRLNNPGYRLVGATYAEVSPAMAGTGTSTQPNSAWTFTFGNLDAGSFFVTQSILNPETGQMMNREVTERYSLETTNQTDIPARPVTIDEVIEYWEAIRPDRFEGEDANFFHWGVAACTDAACLTTTPAEGNSRTGTRLAWDVDDLKRAYAGHICECAGPISVAGPPSELQVPADSSVLMMDVANGTLIAAQHAGLASDARLPAHEGGQASPEVRRIANFSGTTDQGPWILMSVIGAFLVLPPVVFVALRIQTWWRDRDDTAA